MCRIKVSLESQRIISAESLMLSRRNYSKSLQLGEKYSIKSMFYRKKVEKGRKKDNEKRTRRKMNGKNDMFMDVNNAVNELEKK